MPLPLDLSLTFLRSHRNWLKLYFLPPGHLLPSFPASRNLQAQQQQRPRSHKFKKFSRDFLFANPQNKEAPRGGPHFSWTFFSHSNSAAKRKKENFFHFPHTQKKTNQNQVKKRARCVRHFGKFQLYFYRRFYSSRPRLGCVHWREIFEEKKTCIKTGFLLTSGVDLVRPLHWNSKKCRHPRKHELCESPLKFIFWAIYAKNIFKIKLSGLKWKCLTLKITQRDATAQNRTIQETAHKIWLIWSQKHTVPPRHDLSRAKIASQKSSKTLERLFSRRETKLNLHILSFRHRSSPGVAVVLGFTSRNFPQKPAKSRTMCKNLHCRTS